MKPTAVLLRSLGWSTLIACVCSSADESPINLQQTEIIWSAPTNNWPASVWAYKVVPEEYSEAVISNLLVLGSFTSKDRVKSPDYYASDKSAMYFGNEGWKYLAICPALGFIDYHNENAQARMTNSFKGVPRPVVGVPNATEAIELALRYLRMAGVDISQLATKPGTCDLDLHRETGTATYVEQTTKEWITVTNIAGVHFTRRVDGLDVRGSGLCGGARITFGNNSNVVDLQVCWRNLKQHQLVHIPSPEQIIKGIRTGQVALPPRAGPPTEIKKITVTQAAPVYDGKYQGEPMNFVFPLIRLDAVIESSQSTNSFRFEFPVVK